MTTTSNIFTALNEANKRIDAIAKFRRNKLQGFNFRGIDDVYNSLHPVLTECGIVTIPEVLKVEREQRVTANGGTLIYTLLTVRYGFFALDGSGVFATVVGEAMDSGDKATNKAHSAAHKYALLQVFTIPTEDVDDSDADESGDQVAVLATTEQRETITKFADAGKVSATLAEWLTKHDAAMTEAQAAKIIERLQGGAA